MHCLYWWLTYVVVYIVILTRLLPLIWDWFSRISICFLIHSNSALILQSCLFTNYWSKVLWCIVRCLFWWASVAVGWVFCLLIIFICIQGLYLFWQFIGSFSIHLDFQYFLCLTTSNFSVDFQSLRNFFWLSTSISIIVVFDLFSSIKSLFCSWRNALIFYCFVALIGL